MALPLLAYLHCSLYHRSMSESIHGETNDELIVHVAAHGYTVSKRQLAEWHRAGFLAEPEQVHGGRAGSTSIYPAGAAEQLLTLCGCRKRHPHNMSDVAWCMWWQGRMVPMRYIHGMLTDAAAKWSDGLQQLKASRKPRGAEALAGPRMSRLAQAFIDKAETIRITNRDIRGVRKRTRSGNFPTFVRVLFEAALGTFAGFDASANPKTAEEDRAIVEKGFGLERARADRLADSQPWLSGDTGEILHQFGSIVEHYPPGYDLATIDDDELTRTRDEVRTFLTFMESYSAFLERAFGRGAFGLSAFAWLIRRLKPADQGLMLLYWRSCRAGGLGSNLDQMLTTARQWHTFLMPMMRALEEMRTEVPVTAEILSPRQMGKALRNKRVMEQTFRAIRTLREQHTAEFDAFFAQRPEVQQAIDAFDAPKEAEQHQA